VGRFLEDHRMKKLLVLDLDETLIHATTTFTDEYDFNVADYFVYKRTHLEEFLNFCNEYFEIGIWTSSTQDYAEKIVKNIIGDNKFSFLRTRKDCVQIRDIDKDEFVWIKDLKKLKKKGYDLDKILVIDDSPEKLQRNYGNLIQIKPFFGERDDELLLVKMYLETIMYEKNYRVIEKRNWRSKVT